mgnify:CR=1 FL=1
MNLFAVAARRVFFENVHDVVGSLQRKPPQCNSYETKAGGDAERDSRVRELAQDEREHAAQEDGEQGGRLMVASRDPAKLEELGMVDEFQPSL